MVLSQIAELIAAQVGKQFDKPLRLRIEDMIVYWRATWIQRRLERQPSLDKFYSQSILIELEEVSKEECDQLSDCHCEDILRTKQEIPETLIISPNPFSYFGAAGGVTAYGWTTFGNEPNLKASKYTGKMPRYTLLNRYGYVFNEKNAEYVRLEGVFSDPRKLKEFNCPGVEGIKCYDETKDFPLDDKTLQLVITSILTTEFKMILPKEEIEIKADSNA